MPLLQKYGLNSEYLTSLNPDFYNAEKEIRNDLTAKGISGTDLNTLTEYFTRQKQAQGLEAAQNLAENLPGAASALSVPIEYLAGFRNSFETLGNFLAGKEDTTYSKGEFAQNVADTIRGTVTNNIDSNALKTLYGAGMSIGDMAMNLGLGTNSIGMGLGQNEPRVFIK